MKSVLFQTFRVEVESVKFLKLVSIEFLMALRTDSTVLLGGGGGRIRQGAVGWGTALQARMPRVRFPIGSLGFFINLILPALLRPWVRVSEYHEYLLGVKVATAYGWQSYLLHVAII